MKLHILTEERSLKEMLDVILPKLTNISFQVYPHQGKQDLERALRTTIPSLCKIPDSRIIVTRDQDSGDCLRLKRELSEKMESHCFCPYKIRIVCRELESWFLGDLEAIEKAYPQFKSKNFKNKANLRDVDAIVNPSEYLLKLLPPYSSSKYLPKLEVVKRISSHMNIDKNLSRSFGHFIKTVKEFSV